MAEPAVKDPMDMNEDEFAAQVTALSQPPADAPPPADPTDGNDLPPDTGTGTETPPADPPAVEPFRLDDPPATPPQDGAAPPETIEITHNGQVHRLTRDKVVQLAQKGFDYDHKVGRHSKLAQLIDSDAGLRDLITQHIQQRLRPSAPAATPPAAPADPQFNVRPMRQDETEDAWFADQLKQNLGAIAQMLKPQLQPPAPSAAPGTPPADNPMLRMANDVRNILFSMDYENAPKVLPHLAAFARQHLPMDTYVKANSTPENIIKLYKWAAPQILRQITGGVAPTPPAAAPAAPVKPSFRALPGGGQPPRAKGDLPSAFDLSDTDFNKVLAHLKEKG